jgi:hypothetical protein
MIESFVDGRLTASEHELMVHHISSCTECAAAVIAALAEAARALSAEASERLNAATAEAVEVGVALSPAADLNQLDLILDSSSSDASSLLLRPERVHEVQLDDLPAHRSPPREPAVFHPTADLHAVPVEQFAPATSESEPVTIAPEPALAEPVEAVRDPEGMTDPQTVDAAPIEELPAEEPDAKEIATATAAGVAASAAHGAAMLAAGVEEADPRPEPQLVEVFGGEIPEAELAELVIDGEQTWTDATVPESEESSAVAEASDTRVEVLPEESTETPRDERIPDEERAAIAAAVRAGAVDDAPPRRRVSRVLALAAVFLAFVGIAAFAAVQLRGFADAGRPPVVVGSGLATAQPEPPSVLEELLSAERVAFITDLEVDSTVRIAAESLAAPDTTRLPASVEEPPARRPSVAASAGARTPARTRTQGISPEPAVGSRLLRTTTHRVSPDIDFVLREYEADAPAPAPREGVNEYRWTDAAAGRLFVLSGPATVADLRSYARRLQNGGH